MKFILVLSRLVTRNWFAVIVAWIAFAALLRLISPSWTDVVQDGDLDFMPASLPSRVAQSWLDDAYPTNRSRSQITVVFANSSPALSDANKRSMYGVSRVLVHESALSHFARLADKHPSLLEADALQAKLPEASSAEEIEARAIASSELRASLEETKRKLDEAIAHDEIWFDLDRKIREENTATPPRAVPTPQEVSNTESNNRLAVAYWNRAIVCRHMGLDADAEQDRQRALAIDEKVADQPTIERQSKPWKELLDVWTWDDPTIGSKLARKQVARMLVIQFDTDFMAAKNIASLERVESILAPFQADASGGFEIGISGSAAVGGDMLRAAAGSVSQTEWITILLVLGILVVVYRNPLWMAVPLLSIGLSLIVSISLLSMLADHRPNANPLGGYLKVFSTTRIFIVVLLFGVGTDFCMFLISRFREYTHGEDANSTIGKSVERSRWFATHQKRVSNSWLGVVEAIAGSAFTTMAGLSMMYFSEFEKFRYSGIVIAIALFVTLCVCLSFTPALMTGLGWGMSRWASMSALRDVHCTTRIDGDSKNELENDFTGKAVKKKRATFWEWTAAIVCNYPTVVLMGSLLFLIPPALIGWRQQSQVSYDLFRELSPNAVSRKGFAIIEKHFNAFDASPITLLIQTADSKTEDEMRTAIEQMRPLLYGAGATSVRTVTDPLGQYPPGKKMGMLSSDSWRRRALERHPTVQSQFFSADDSPFANRLSRFDIVIDKDPFSKAAIDRLSQIREVVDKQVVSPESPWFRATYAFGGTTAGITDLEQVTQQDQPRIQRLATLGVAIVLLILLRKIWLSLFLMGTVLLSYFATLGMTITFFSWMRGDTFTGLNWKVPLFLFVILVAVGQDYNVFLVSRVIEEQRRRGLLEGIRVAMSRTGGIITSCGVVMAATFLSMSFGSVSRFLGEVGWPAWTGANPDHLVLNGIVELGFALSLGVMIDTLVVRTILVPSVLVLVGVAKERRMKSASG